MTVDATTQPGYDGTPLITMEKDPYDPKPTYIPSGSDGDTFRGLIFAGIEATGATNLTVQDCDLTGQFDFPGVYLDGVTNALFEGNTIGTDVSGSTATGTSYGVEIFDGSTGITIGGTASEARNIISGNADYGVYIDGSDNNVVEGNWIGIGPSGAAPPAGFTGRSVAGTAPVPASGGMASTAQGIRPGGGGGSPGGVSSHPGVINSGGFEAVPNGGGVYIGDSATGNTVGGTASGAGNVISGNDGDGVVIDDAAGNLVEGT